MVGELCGVCQNDSGHQEEESRCISTLPRLSSSCHQGGEEEEERSGGEEQEREQDDDGGHCKKMFVQEKTNASSFEEPEQTFPQENERRKSNTGGVCRRHEATGDVVLVPGEEEEEEAELAGTGNDASGEGKENLGAGSASAGSALSSSSFSTCGFSFEESPDTSFLEKEEKANLQRLQLRSLHADPAGLGEASSPHDEDPQNNPPHPHSAGQPFRLWI